MRQYPPTLIRWAVEDKQKELFNHFLLISIDDSKAKNPKRANTFLSWISILMPKRKKDMVMEFHLSPFISNVGFVLSLSM